MEGVRVLEVAQFTFVPAAGAILADWGADVIKVEHPVRGDTQRGFINMGGLQLDPNRHPLIEHPNRGKRSVGLALEVPSAHAILMELVSDADVFLTNFLPAARRKLHIDVEDIRKVNPKIIYARGHGHGVRGPDVEKGGYDAASFWSRGGIAHALTPPDAERPTMQRAAFGDSAGGMTTAGGIAAALFRRERTGEPSVIDVSLLGTAMWILAPDIVLAKFTDQEMPMFARTQAPNPIVNSYKTKDGRWVFLNMLQPDRFWADFCTHIGRSDMITDARFESGMARFQNREACVAELDETFASHTLAEWREKLDDVEGVWAPMQTAKEVGFDRQALANNYLSEVDRGDGTTFTLVSSPVQFDETTPTLTPGPDMGQHTEAVLLDLGYTWDDLAALKEAGAIS